LGHPYDQRGYLIEPILVVLLLSGESDRTTRLLEAARTRDYRTFAEVQMSKEQFECLDELWQKESSWQTKKKPYLADNPNSSAYGIPQALPGNKMATFGKDWKHNPITQVRWGLNYIKERYKTPCAALAHHKRKNWY